MLRAAVLGLLLALTVAPAPRAETRVLDTTTGASTTLVRGTSEDPSRLLRWTDDGAGLLVRPRGTVLRIGVPDRSVRKLPNLDAAQSVGPGGRWVELRTDRAGRPLVRLHAADDTRVGSYRFGASYADPQVAWSADGSRVALAIAPRVVVADTATGAVVLRRTVGSLVGLTPQAFAPDAGALLLTERTKVVRVELPSGAATTLLRGERGDAPRAVWGASGRIAVTLGDRVRVLDDPPLDVPTGADRLGAVAWSQAGSELDYRFAGPLDDCLLPSEGLAAVVPGQAPRVVLPAEDRELIGWTWSPDGTKLAVDLAPGDSTSEQRGRRHRRPKHVPLDFALFSPQANAAARRVVLRAVRSLDAGAGRGETLRDVRLGMADIGARYSGGDDSAVLEAVADALDPWLRAAGFARIEALDEVLCA